MPLAFKDYYTTLGLSKQASPEEIKKAFRLLARQYHPDVAVDKKAAEEKFREINEANEVLSDPEKRKKYDTLGADWKKEAHGPSGAERQAQNPSEEFQFGGSGFSDFFEQFFSGANRYGAPEDENPSSRGHDIEGELLVTLEEVMKGTLRTISLQSADGEKQQFQVRIPVGAMEGKRLRVPGHGARGSGGAAKGDLYLKIRYASHANFTTQEADLFYELEMAPWEVVLGAEILVETLDGSIKMTIPPGTDHGQKLRVRGRGLPKGKSGERGDFFVVIQVCIPKKISSEEEALWKQLQAISTFQVRGGNPK